MFIKIRIVLTCNLPKHHFSMTMQIESALWYQCYVFGGKLVWIISPGFLYFLGFYIYIVFMSVNQLSWCKTNHVVKAKLWPDYKNHTWVLSFSYSKGPFTPLCCTVVQLILNVTLTHCRQYTVMHYYIICALQQVWLLIYCGVFIWMGFPNAMRIHCTPSVTLAWLDPNAPSILGGRKESPQHPHEIILRMTRAATLWVCSWILEPWHISRLNKH